MSVRDRIVIAVLFLSFRAFLFANDLKRKRFLEKELERRSVLEFKKGDFVLTYSGIYGKIEEIKGERVLLRICENATVTVNESAILKKAEE